MSDHYTRAWLDHMSILDLLRLLDMRWREERRKEDEEYVADLIAKNRPPKGDKRLLTHAPAIDKTRGT